MAGLCVNCPPNCLTCQYDLYYRSLLECIACETGYSIVKGQCSLSCNFNQGYSMVNGICTKCLDPNCNNCTTNPNICLQCGLLYTLSNGTCSCIIMYLFSFLLKYNAISDGCFFSNILPWGKYFLPGNFDISL